VREAVPRKQKGAELEKAKIVHEKEGDARILYASTTLCPLTWENQWYDRPLARSDFVD